MEYALSKCRLPIDGLGLCKAREAYGDSLRFLYAVRFVQTTFGMEKLSLKIVFFPRSCSMEDILIPSRKWNHCLIVIMFL